MPARVPPASRTGRIPQVVRRDRAQVLADLAAQVQVRVRGLRRVRRARMAIPETRRAFLRTTPIPTASIPMGSHALHARQVHGQPATAHPAGRAAPSPAVPGRVARSRAAIAARVVVAIMAAMAEQG